MRINPTVIMPESLTHQHLLSCLTTLLFHEISGMSRGYNKIRILDAGCGAGRLMSFVYRSLSDQYPDCTVEIYGFDVIDHGVQASGFIERAVTSLSDDIPSIDWAQQIKPIRIDDSWPFQDNFFDVVLSNQVIEHVHNKPYFFAESHRVLREGGYGIHLFPLKHYVYEGHLNLPWVHRIRSYGSMVCYISILSFLWLGKFRDHHKRTGISRSDFSEQHADYVYFWTNYASEAEILDIVRQQMFRASFMFSIEFYVLKLRQLLGLNYKKAYMTLFLRGLWDSIAIKFLRYLSSVTLVTEKSNTYKEPKL